MLQIGIREPKATHFIAYDDGNICHIAVVKCYRADGNHKQRFW